MIEECHIGELHKLLEHVPFRSLLPQKYIKLIEFYSVNYWELFLGTMHVDFSYMRPACVECRRDTRNDGL